MAQGILVASVCQGVVRTKVFPAHAGPILLLSPRPRSDPPPHLGNRQHWELGLWLRGRNLGGAYLGAYW